MYKRAKTPVSELVIELVSVVLLCIVSDIELLLV
jgi:hypothetical protein